MAGEATLENVIDTFKFHPPKDEGTSDKHVAIRELIGNTAVEIYLQVPDCSERTYAIDKLREAMMWANAGIAIHQ